MTENLQTITLDDRLWQELLELTRGEASPCFQCGVCTAVCPWADVRDQGFNVRDILRAAQLGNLQELEPLWLCSACLQCEASCPRGVRISEVLRSLRYLLWKRGSHLHTLPSTLWSTYWNNNPLGQPPSTRMDWAKDLDLEDFNATEHEWLLYLGCTASYDRRAQDIARATVKVLRKAGVRFGVLGLEEPCCGETVLRLGHHPYFEEIARKAVDTFSNRGVENMVVLSPHCFDVFRNHYPPFDLACEIQHITQLLADCLENGNLRFRPAGEGLKLTYHDPCLLGRGNDIYEAPRRILNAIAGSEVMTIDPEKDQALCCGGGGGRMFLETPPGQRFGDIRVRQARQTGASVLVTACPLCTACLEDSMKVVAGVIMPVRDVVEIAAEYAEQA